MNIPLAVGSQTARRRRDIYTIGAQHMCGTVECIVWNVLYGGIVTPG